MAPHFVWIHCLFFLAFSFKKSREIHFDSALKCSFIARFAAYSCIKSQNSFRLCGKMFIYRSICSIFMHKMMKFASILCYNLNLTQLFAYFLKKICSIFMHKITWNSLRFCAEILIYDFAMKSIELCAKILILCTICIQ